MRKRASDFTLEYVVETLASAGLLSDEGRKLALAREHVQRARLLADLATRRRERGTRAPLSPLTILASFKFPVASRPSEVLDEDRATEAIARVAGVPYRKLDPLKLDAALVTKTLSRPFARRHVAVPIDLAGERMLLAVGNPFDDELLENLRGVTGRDVAAVLSSPSDIQRAIAEIYGFRKSIRDAETAVTGLGASEVWNLAQLVSLNGLEALEAGSEPIVAAVEYLLHYAFEQRASDIHIEPRRDESLIRLRIDGVLHAVHRVPRSVHSAIVNRLKVLARLDIALKRPQDGRIRTALGDAEMELRVSAVPTAFGDKIVVRVLDPTALVRDLSELGLLDEEKGELERWLGRPHGLIVATGPTGSGKTTTLYSALQALASPEVNIVTIEDPIEMVHEGWSQIQASAKQGTGFPDALRHVLRQDPDVIMVGEVRDGETATRAVQASLTGHLVLTTLHTNDTVGAIARLRDLGVPSFLLAATLAGVVAQRLARRVCSACGQDVTLTLDEIAELGVAHPEDYAGDLVARRGAGCPKCRYTGYFGRTGIYEILPIGRRMKQLVSDGAGPEELARAARQDGQRSLREHAIRKVAAGITSLEEALRVTADAEPL